MMTSPPSIRSFNCLVIEDEPEQAAVLKRWLELDLSAKVDHVDDGLKARERLKDPKYDIIVADIGLPGRDGLSVIDQSKKLFPHRPALVVTAFEGRAVLLEALRKRADDFLSKPLSREFVVGRIRKLMSTRPTIQRNKVLAISAHADDVEIGCGGALLQHRNAGDRIVHLVLTDSALGGDPERRREEVAAAAQGLGAKMLFAGMCDGELPDGSETIALIQEVVSEHRPDIVYSHTIHDTHQDHRAAAAAARVAARTVKSLYCYQSPSSTIEFKPSRFVPVEDTLDEKVELIKGFESQRERCGYLDEHIIRSTAHYWGRFAGFRPVEPLEVIRDSA